MNRLMKCGCLLFLFMTRMPADALPEYGDHQWTAGKRTVVRVYELETGRPIWTRSYPSVLSTYPDNGTFFWSRNKRALAFAVGKEQTENNSGGNYEGYHIVIWRAKKSIHIIAHKPVTIHNDGKDIVTAHDYVEDMAWSSDGNFLLIWGGGSGEDMADLGHLYCYNAVNQKIYSLGLSIGRPLWVGRKTAKFWTPEFLSDNGGGPGMARARRPTFWTVPRRQRHLDK